MVFQSPRSSRPIRRSPRRQRPFNRTILVLAVGRRAKKVTIEKANTTIVSGAGKKVDIEARIAQIKAQIDHLRL